MQPNSGKFDQTYQSSVWDLVQFFKQYRFCLLQNPYYLGPLYCILKQKYSTLMQTGYVSITPLRLDTDLSFSETQIPSKWDISHLLCTFHLPRVYKIKFKIEVRQSVQCGCCECQKLSSDWLSTSGHPKNPAPEKINTQPEKKNRCI